MTRSPLSPRTIGALALINAIALGGCASTGSSPSASAATSSLPSASALSSVPPSVPASAEPTSTATAIPSVEPSESLIPFACVPSVTVAKSVDRAQISDVRVGTHDGYDRVTFQFAAGIPQTVVEGVLPPFFADPSGQSIEVKGTVFLKVIMNGGTRFSPDGSLSYVGSINFLPGFPQLVQLREGGDFEAVSNWYIGLNGGGCYRVMTLMSPARLVIDIEH
jgi:hypothetical protein